MRASRGSVALTEGMVGMAEWTLRAKKRVYAYAAGAGKLGPRGRACLGAHTLRAARDHRNFTEVARSAGEFLGNFTEVARARKLDD